LRFAHPVYKAARTRIKILAIVALPCYASGILPQLRPTPMTTIRIPSPRADARRRYLVVANAQGLGAADAPAGANVAVDTPLMTRVRTLYEDTVVPVREIARLAGVTEVTIYKYARKRGWRPRVVRLAKGAGGRFIPLADVGQPVASGLKALDPEGAARAAARCARAELISEEAAAAAVEAARERAAHKAAATAARRRERVLAQVTRELGRLVKMRQQMKHGNPRLLGLADRVAQALVKHMERLLG
jgi:hypothetical protein